MVLKSPGSCVYAAVFIDATVVKVRDGQVANRAFYVAVGVDLEGGRDVLGIWASPAAEGARYWLSVLTEMKNRGVDDVFFLICDGLKGLPDAVGAVWPLAIVQTCVVHLLRNTFRHASKKDWDAIKRDVKPIYTAERRRRGGGPRRDAGQVGGEISRDPQAVDGRAGNGSYRSWTMTWRSGA